MQGDALRPEGSFRKDTGGGRSEDCGVESGVPRRGPRVQRGGHRSPSQGWSPRLGWPSSEAVGTRTQGPSTCWVPGSQHNARRPGADETTLPSHRRCLGYCSLMSAPASWAPRGNGVSGTQVVPPPGQPVPPAAVPPAARDSSGLEDPRGSPLPSAPRAQRPSRPH